MNRLLDRLLSSAVYAPETGAGSEGSVPTLAPGVPIVTGGTEAAASGEDVEGFGDDSFDSDGEVDSFLSPSELAPAATNEPLAERSVAEPEKAAPSPDGTKPAGATPETVIPRQEAAVPPDPSKPTATDPATATPTDPAAAAPGAEKTFVQRLDESRETIQKTLETTRFQLTEEERNLFEGGDPAVVSKFGARVYVETVRTTFELIDKALPNLVSAAIEARESQTKAVDEFFGPHPDLKPYSKQVTQLVATLRQMNPNMPKEQFIERLAAAARTTLGLQTPAAGAAQTQAAAPRTNGRHAPVVSSVPGTMQAPVVAPDDWGALSQMFEADT